MKIVINSMAIATIAAYYISMIFLHGTVSHDADGNHDDTYHNGSSREYRNTRIHTVLSTDKRQQKLILYVMKNIDCNDIKNVDDMAKKNIDKALDFVRAYDYLKIDNAGINVSGIPDKPHDLSYVEKRALKAKVLDDLLKSYNKELEFGRKMEPEIIDPEILDSQLMDLKAREKELLTELAAKKVALSETLVENVGLRFGPNEKSASELIKAKLSLGRVKAQLINTLLHENINSMSEHINKAMDKMEFILDCAIAQKNGDSIEKSDSK